jgi:glycerol uptake facilitator-like aquaporin
MEERLAGGDDAIALLANAFATGYGLYALIVAFADRSGAHFNPVVSVALSSKRGTSICPVIDTQDRAHRF